MKDWQSGFADANGLRLHYTRTGGDRPPIVLAHGVTIAGSAGRRWRRRWPPTTTSSWSMPAGTANPKRPPMATILPRKPVTWRGSLPPSNYSGQRSLATPWARQPRWCSPENTPMSPAAILLEDPPSWWTSWYETQDAGDRVAEMRATAMARKQMTRADLIAEQRELFPTWSDDELEPWADAKQAISLNVLSIFDRSNPSSVDWPETMRQITCPALLITADHAWRDRHRRDRGGATGTDSSARSRQHP